MKSFAAVLAVVVFMVGCGVGAPEVTADASVSSGLGSAGLCSPLSGTYLGAYTVTEIDPSTRCSGPVGSVFGSQGVEFAPSGDFVTWVNAGAFGLTCTTTYSDCAAVVQCVNADSTNSLALTWALTFDNAGNVAGTYTLTGGGSFCPHFKASVALVKQ